MKNPIPWLLRSLLTLCLAVGLAAQNSGEHALLAGGENASGGGVWILPCCAFAAPQSVPADVVIEVVGSGSPITIPGGCMRVRDDLVVSFGGVPIAVAVGYFNGAQPRGAFYDVASGQDLNWVRV